NLPSVATPNGQSAFLFLLTSSIAPLIKLPYCKMMWMAVPYTIVLTLVGLFCVWVLVPDVSAFFIEKGWVALICKTV
ncbi:MAG TPA: sodium/proton antiporter, partial [Succinivibrionaceae bacterium]|nr:sodium/proton antiporter [Succinivibrionaceae bacterium]